MVQFSEIKFFTTLYYPVQWSAQLFSLVQFKMACCLRMTVSPQEPLLATVKRWKLAWFEHVTCHNSLSKTNLQGTLEGGWVCGWQRECWMDNIKEWTYPPMPELLTRASCQKDWKGLCWVAPHVPLMSETVKGLNWTEDGISALGKQMYCTPLQTPP